jgi:hypothetical protein
MRRSEWHQGAGAVDPDNGIAADAAELGAESDLSAIGEFGGRPADGTRGKLLETLMSIAVFEIRTSTKHRRSIGYFAGDAFGWPLKCHLLEQRCDHDRDHLE